MVTPFVGQIILVGFNFEPNGWRFCNGQLLPIAGNDTLFNLIGTTFGGDGQLTFAVPDLRGRLPIGMGQGAGLSNYILGEASGAESVTVTVNQMPAHTHPVDVSPIAVTQKCTNGVANQRSPMGNVPAIEASGATMTYSNAAPDANMNGGAVAIAGTPTAANTGATMAHENRQPYLGMNFCISLDGIFPSQT